MSGATQVFLLIFSKKSGLIIILFNFTRKLLEVLLVELLLRRHLMLIEEILLALLELHGLRLRLLVVLAAVCAVSLVVGASQMDWNAVLGNFLIDEIRTLLACLLGRAL